MEQLGASSHIEFRSEILLVVLVENNLCAIKRNLDEIKKKNLIPNSLRSLHLFAVRNGFASG